MTDAAFDPTRYLTKVSGRDYLTVQWRLVWLRSEHPLAKIETELVKLVEGGAIFRATITLPPVAVDRVDPTNGSLEGYESWSATATGYGSETAADFGDYLEKAETKAIGRALAALGFGTQFALDFGGDEPPAGRIVDSPVQRPAPPRPSQPRQDAGGGAAIGDTPSDKQLKYLHALRRDHHWPEDAFRDLLTQRYGVDSTGDLVRRQVSELIEFLNTHGPYVDPRQRQLPVGAGGPPPEPDDLPEPGGDPWNGFGSR